MGEKYEKNKIYYWYIFRLSSIAIITPIATSCSKNSTTQTTNMDYLNEINEAQKHIITEQSAIDLNDMFTKNVSSRNNNDEIIRLSKNDIAKKLL